jgi:hypothetical protein
VDALAEQICITAVERLRAATLGRQKAPLSSCRAVIIQLLCSSAKLNAPDAIFVKALWQRTDFALAHKNGTGAILAGVSTMAHTGFPLGYHGPYLEHGHVLIKGSGLRYRVASLALLIPQKQRILLL